MHRTQVNKNKLLEQPCARAGQPRAAVAGKEHGLCPGLMVDLHRAAAASAHREHRGYILSSRQQTQGSLGAGDPGGAQGGPHSRRNVKCFHTCSLLLFCSHFFPPQCFSNSCLAARVHINNA